MSKYRDSYEIQSEERTTDGLRRMRCRLRGKLDVQEDDVDVDIVAVMKGYVSLSVFSLHFGVGPAMEDLGSSCIAGMNAEKKEE